MKLLIFFLLLTSIAYGQDSIALWSDPIFVPKGQVNSAINSGSKDLVLFEVDKNKYYKLSEVTPVWTISATFESNASQWTYNGGWQIVQPGAGQDKFSARDFAWIPSPNGTQTATISLTLESNSRISFWSERAGGHGNYQLVVKKGNTVVETSPVINAGALLYNSDFNNGTPSWSSRTLDAGMYSLEVSPAGQLVVDKVTVEKLTY